MATTVTGILFVFCLLQPCLCSDEYRYLTLVDRTRLIEETRVNGRTTDCVVLADRTIIMYVLQAVPVKLIQEIEMIEMSNHINACHDLHMTLKDSQLRKKRAFAAIYPGTKWCGQGNITEANNYNDLGYYRETDACCREHDGCPDWIAPFATKYGLKNWSLYYRLDCKCDSKFYSCLKRSTNGAANDVGRIFFNVLRLMCFKDVHPDKCVKRGWWNWCVKYAKDRTRVVKKFVNSPWF